MKMSGSSHLFGSKDEAIAGVLARLDRQTSKQCRGRIFQECGTVPDPLPAEVPLVTPA